MAPKNRLSIAALKHADLVITAQWSTDRTDLDLHVIEPDGERCYYRQQRTKSGGTLTSDVTAGYGPEMYSIAKAQPGLYKVEMHFYRGDTNRTQSESTVQLNVYRNFDGQGTQVERHTVTLQDVKDQRELLTIKVPGKAATKK